MAAAITPRKMRASRCKRSSTHKVCSCAIYIDHDVLAVLQAVKRAEVEQSILGSEERAEGRRVPLPALQHLGLESRPPAEVVDDHVAAYRDQVIQIVEDVRRTVVNCHVQSKDKTRNRTQEHLGFACARSRAACTRCEATYCRRPS